MKDDNNNDSLPEDGTKPDDKSLVDNDLDAKLDTENPNGEDLNANHADTASSDDLDPAKPAKEEAGWLRHWYRQGFVTKIVMVLVVILIVILLGAYYAVGTPWGTRLLINAIVQETGISLTYGKGNLRDGIWVYVLKIPSKPP